MKIKEFDTVRLRDGRVGSVMDVEGDQAEFVVDVGSSPKDWETLYDVKPEDIIEVIESNPE
ncbi:hypothetical protein [Caproicibacterium lactatifermentans]|jgi:hypothetical protein|uniref:DUF4926 domain-containing protein n=1 Tax=Caproicibacterium lactatifermentans TaxID=2666138 RepID=A0ABX6PTK2_9FIRM|nr:hypothetical protein [Caproicibacterium lactatifermentans]ARP50470.1 hypothetical protein B6259_06010 [Ruminococcaceae bacterium CPB6]QKO29553.1 hypothetical protein GKP14_00020 [Caproicibacterium lactatifermentans]